ncbi:hypothetical protein, partial [Staphylococcus aureus]
MPLIYERFQLYIVLTSGNQPFTYELPKDLSSHNARKYLEFISQK